MKGPAQVVSILIVVKFPPAVTAFGITRGLTWRSQFLLW